MMNILAKTREKVGKGFPLICRIGADEVVEGGLTLVDAKEIAVLLAENSVDIIHVSGSLPESRSLSIMPPGGSVEYIEMPVEERARLFSTEAWPERCVSFVG